MSLEELRALLSEALGRVANLTVDIARALSAVEDAIRERE